MIPDRRHDVPHVVVVGSAHMDLIANAPRLPSPGESLLGSDFGMYPGGKGGNQAVAAAQQGASTAIIARVGDDAFGNQLRESLARKQVDVSLLQIDTAAATGVSPVLMGSDGEYASIVVPGASLSLTPAHLEAASEALRSCDVLMLQLEIGMPVSAAAAFLARSAGATVVINVAPAAAVSNASRWEIWRDVDIVVANRDEAEALSGVAVDGAASGIRAATALRMSLGVAGVIVTLGAAGAVLADVSGEIRDPGYEVDVIDTIGAGDAFAGSVAAALARGVGLREAVRLGNAAAALAVGRRGAYDACPTLAETEEFLAANVRRGTR
jgi:ribokinase